MNRLKLFFLLCALLLSGVPRSLFAQEPAPPPPVQGPEAPTPVITPPELLQFVEATYPPEALAQNLSARVELELIVGVDGSVTDAKVKTPAGNGFDEAALVAGWALKFKPATRDGVPIAARVVLPYVFEWKEPEPLPSAEPPPPPPARLEGSVLNADNDQPLRGVEVIVSDNVGQARRSTTDPAGRFSIEDLPAGVYHVSLTHPPEWLGQDSDETLVAGEATELVYRMRPAPDPEAFRAVARVPPPSREVTRRTIGKEELTRMPGTRGDALRTVELLPGVARPPLGAGVLIIRGSAPNDTQVYLDGVPVPLLYHFGGLTSFINSRFLESIDFYPGNFSVRYGRRRGGIIEAHLVDPTRNKVEAVLDLNLIDGSAVVQGPITSKWDFALAARRSWLDIVLGEALDSADINTIAAPVYYDYQAMSTFRPSDRDKLRLMIYGSSDKFKLLFTEPRDEDAALRGQFNLSTEFHRVHASWARKISDRIDHDLSLAAGVYDVNFAVGDAFAFALSGTDVYLRSEWRARATDRVRLIAGLDVNYLPGQVDYKGPPPNQSEGDPDNGANATSPSNRDEFTGRDEFNVLQPALYFESDLDLDPLRIVLGSRIDYYSDIGEFSFDPRLSASYSISDQTRLKVGVGMFTQPPQFQESSPIFGNPKLLPTHTIHLGLGVDHEFVPGFKVGLEGFYKHLYDRVIGSEFGEEPYFVNGGKGRIFGLEVSAKIEPRGRFFGYLSYTLSRSERLDRNDGYRLFDFDQPHILTVAGVYRLGRGWEAGATFRLVSGNPDTPVIGAIYNKDTDLYSPVFGRLNSIRSPYFHRLDVRIEKLWKFSGWKLALYADVQNVYSNANVEGVVYDFEYRTSQEITGIPILPNIGVRGEL